MFTNGVRAINVGINGYEPTAFKYFFEVLEFIKDKNISVNLFTNGVYLSDENYVKKLSKLIDVVTITLYSSNDAEHNTLTQNDDSYLLKHKAIEYSLKYGIQVSLNILLLTPITANLDILFTQIRPYFNNKNFSRVVQLIVPNSVMGKERNKILIPSYTFIVSRIEKILKEFSDTFLENSIILEVSCTIPKCLFNFPYDSRVLVFGKERNLQDSKNLNTSYSSINRFFQKCKKCDFFSSCVGVEQSYLDLYGSSEVENGTFIETKYSLYSINNSLLNLLSKYKTEGIWFDYEYLDTLVKENKKIFMLPRFMLDYYIKDVFILKGKIKKIRFSNRKTKDSFIFNLNVDELKNYTFSLSDGNKTNLPYYNIILIFLNKVFNKEVLAKRTKERDEKK